MGEGENLGKFEVLSSPTGSRRKTSLPEGTILNLRLPHGKIVIIMQCSPWAVGWSPEGNFLGVFYGENRQESENWANLTPYSFPIVHRTKR